MIKVNTKIVDSQEKLKVDRNSFTNKKSGAGATLKKGNKVIKTWSFQWPTTKSNMWSNRVEIFVLLMAYQALWWSDTRHFSYVGTTLETKKKVNLIAEHILEFNVKADHLIRLSEMSNKSSVLIRSTTSSKEYTINRMVLQEVLKTTTKIEAILLNKDNLNSLISSKLESVTYFSPR
ncbi:hypothetical protein ACTFIW_001033 [Dictyostelium discoideum]